MELGLKADSEDRYKRFIEVAKEQKEVWGLRSSNGWAITPSTEFEGSQVMPFWSHRSYAQRAAEGEWADYVPTKINLNEFIDGWLRGMSKDGVLVGANWNAQLIGKEIEASKLAAELI